jgi:hypothetical protein
MVADNMAVIIFFHDIRPCRFISVSILVIKAEKVAAIRIIQHAEQAVAA